MRAVLEKYVGEQVGINCKEAAKYHSAKLVSANDRYFTVELADPKVTVHYPYSQLMFVSESLSGFKTAGFFSGNRVRAFLQVNILAIGGNGFGVGVGVAF